jgi:hypothetical protein
VKPGVETGECGSRSAVDTDGLSSPVLCADARGTSSIVADNSEGRGLENGVGGKVETEGRVRETERRRLPWWARRNRKLLLANITLRLAT